MKIRYKIMASMLAILGLLITVAISAYYASLTVEFYRQRTAALDSQLVVLTNLRAQVRNQLLETYEVVFVEGVENHLADIKVEQDKVALRFQELKQAFQLDEDSILVSELQKEYDELNASLGRVLELGAKGKSADAKAALLKARVEKFNAGFIKNISDLVDAQKISFSEGSSNLEKSIKRQQNTLVLLAVMAILLASSLTIFISRSIGNRLARLEAATNEISEGNFGTTLSENGSDEVSALSRAFNQMTDSLVQARDELVKQQQIMVSSSKMSALGEMAGGVAHEINSPLATISTIAGQMVEVVDDEPLDVPLLKEMAEKIGVTTSRIAKIVQGLKTFSRDGGKDPFFPVKVKSLVEETLSFCEERLKNTGTKLILSEIPEALSFDGRASQMSQVLLNLLNNASDAIGGMQDKWIKVSVASGEGWLELRITDSGPGISPQLRQKIFQPFFTTKPIGSGTGMGLSISLGIIKGHKGLLSVDDQSANTCFVIRLPKSNSASRLNPAA